MLNKQVGSNMQHVFNSTPISHFYTACDLQGAQTDYVLLSLYRSLRSWCEALNHDVNPKTLEIPMAGTTKRLELRCFSPPSCWISEGSQADVAGNMLSHTWMVARMCRRHSTGRNFQEAKTAENKIRCCPSCSRTRWKVPDLSRFQARIEIITNSLVC